MTARDIVMSAAGNAGDGKTYIEDVFSTYLYTGNGSTQTINNGIDLAGKGGMVWTKIRNQSVGHCLVDTNRGIANVLDSSYAGAQNSDGKISSVNSNGYTITGDYYNTYNGSGNTYASWTFRKAPKFFDVVTWTGDGVAGRQISHSLGVAPGMIIIKDTNGTSSWFVSGSNMASDSFLQLNSTAAAISGLPNCYSATSTTFTPTYRNSSGTTYVAYLFAHDTTTDGLIQCGSYSGTNQVNLGWEPQYVMIKATGSASWGDWYIMDNMRGLSAKESADLTLEANLANAEGYQSGWLTINATGFKPTYAESGQTYIYMAIRRGPMKTPTDPTKVFDINTFAYSGTPYRSYSGFVTDMSIDKGYAGTYGVSNWQWQERLVGSTNYLKSNATDAEATNSNLGFDYNDGVSFNNSVSVASGSNNVHYQFRRAPGFFDVVCYTGNGSAGRVINHNLGVAPELIIFKARNNGTYNWTVQAVGPLSYTSNMDLNTISSNATNGQTYAYTSGNTTSITTGSDNTIYLNASGINYVNYLFASCPGVSKVFSVTKTSGSNANVDCGFSTGARFVMLKRTDATGDWYVWDTARGIVSANDPYLLLNSTAAENTSTDYIDPLASGFTIVDGGLANGSYIGLAIA